MLEKKSLQLFHLLLSMNPKSYPLFIENIQMSKRQFFYHLDKINYFLRQNQVPPISITQKEIRVPEEVFDQWKTGRLNILPKDFQFDEEERSYLLLIYTFIRGEPISNTHYQFLLNVSKNTATAAVRQANQFSKKFRVDIRYSREKGFHLEGQEEDKRNLTLKCISMFSSHPKKHEILRHLLRKHGYEDRFQLYEGKLREIGASFGLTFIEERLFDFLYLLQMIHIRQRQKKWVQIHADTMEFLKKQKMYQVARTIQEVLGESTDPQELAYLTMLLLGITLGNLSAVPSGILKTMTEKMIHDFEKFACIQIQDKEKAVNTLFSHFKPAYYRMLYKIPITNPLLNEIKKEHATLFHLVTEVMKPIQEMLNIDIPEDEIGFLTLHFGALLEQNARNEKPIQAIIVCPNGVSSSLMVETYLRSLFPSFRWITSISKEEFSKTDEELYDIVFSTVPFKTEKPLFIVKPIMSEAEKKMLHHRVMEHLFKQPAPFPTPERLIKIIGKYAEIKEPEKLKDAITMELYGKTGGTTIRRIQPLLNELLTETMIQFETAVPDWKNAIAKAAEPLLKNGYIEPSYIEAMITNVEKMGPYFIIHPGIAIPHARPENGVNKLGMSFLKLKEPAYLLNEEKNAASVFICLAAVDNTTHLKALSQLTRLLGNKESLDRLLNVKNPAELIALIEEYSAERQDGSKNH